jgi:L-ascorbate metabolism protein UlaG (beta-lactamase superfamily)
MEVPSRRRKILRRQIIGGVGAVGVAGAAAALYRAAPSFWQQYAREWKQPVEDPAFRPRPELWPDRGLYAAWLGHSTVLLKIDGFTILTDPVFSTRAGIHLGLLTLGVKRLVAPALEPEKLPRVDLILLSHAHMDHFDLPSLRLLEKKSTQVIAARRTTDLLRAERYGRVQEVGWNEAVQAGPVTVRGVEVNHWGARVRTDNWRGYNGYVIEAGRWRVLFAGDTAITESFRQLPATREVDLAVMPIGAYNPWIRYHCNPEQAWRMANDARAGLVMPVHHQTFQLSREPRREPIERLVAAAGSAHQRVALRDIGQELRLT